MAIRDILVLNTTASRAETQQGSDTVVIKGNSGEALSVENSSGTSILSVNTVSSSVNVAGKITATTDVSSSLGSSGSFGRLEATTLIGSAFNLTNTAIPGTISSSGQIANQISGSFRRGFEFTGTIGDTIPDQQNKVTASFGRIVAITFSGSAAGLTNTDLDNTISSSAQIASQISGAFTSGFEFDGIISGSAASTGSFGRVEAIRLIGDVRNMTNILKAGIVTGSGQLAVSGAFNAGFEYEGIVSGSSKSTGSFNSTIADKAIGNISAMTNIVPSNTISSSAQISSNISGSFNKGFEYIGTIKKGLGAWSTVADTNSSVGGGRCTTLGGFQMTGTKEAAMIVDLYCNTEIWNGSSWSEVNNRIDYAILGGGAAGTANDAIIYGGIQMPTYDVRAFTEEWNGTNWSEGTDINTARYAGGSAGYLSSENALYFGGLDYPHTTCYQHTEEWNGSSWSELNNLNQSKRIYTTGLGTTEAALAVGTTFVPTVYGNTEEWNGTNWSEVAVNAFAGPTGLGQPYNNYHDRGAGGGTVNDGHVFGGTGHGGPGQSHSLRYDGTSWSQDAPLTNVRRYLSGRGSTGGNVIAVGGCNYPQGTEIFTEAIPTTGSFGRIEAISISGDGSNLTNSAIAGTISSSGQIASQISGTFINGLTFTGKIQSKNTQFTWPGAVETLHAGQNGGNVSPYDAGSEGRGYSGINNAALAAGGARLVGYQLQPNTEIYDGTSWTEVNDLNTGGSGGAAGTTNATVMSSAIRGGCTEIWNGTNWSEVNDMIFTSYAAYGKFGANNFGSQRGYIAHFGHSQNSMVQMSTNTSPYRQTEEWNGTNWSTGPTSPADMREWGPGAGAGDSGLQAGGAGGSPNSRYNSTRSITSLYNGVSWSEGNDMPQDQFGRFGFYAIAGSQNDAITMAYGGCKYAGSPSTQPGNQGGLQGVARYNGAIWYQEGFNVNDSSGPIIHNGGIAYGGAAGTESSNALFSGILFVSSPFTVCNTPGATDANPRYGITFEVTEASHNSASFSNVDAQELSASVDLMSNIPVPDGVISGSAQIETSISGSFNKGFEFTGKIDSIAAWSNGGTYPGPNCGQMGAFGTQNSAVMMPGNRAHGPFFGETYLYNGSSWSDAGANMVRGRGGSSVIGTSEAGIAIGGRSRLPGFGYESGCCTETWNGSAWAVEKSLSYHLFNLNQHRSGTQNSALLSGGGTTENNSLDKQNHTITWDGNSYTHVANMINYRSCGNSNGSQNAALAQGSGLASVVSSTCTEEWNGTAWSTAAASNITTGCVVMSAGDSSYDTMIVNCYTAPGYNTGCNCSDFYNGISWSIGPLANSTVNYRSNASTGTTQASFFKDSTGAVEEFTTVNASASIDRVDANELEVANNSTLVVSQSMQMPIFFANPPVTSSAGEVWYNSTEEKLYFTYDINSWTEVSDLNQTRRGTSVVGHRGLALAAGGRISNSSPYMSSCTELWDGNTWTAVNATNEDQGFGGMAGTACAAILMSTGGAQGTEGNELWNGTNWSVGPDGGIGDGGSMASGTANASIHTGGVGGSGQSCNGTAEWNGSVFYSAGTMPTARGGHGQTGTQNAAYLFGGGTWTGPPAAVQQDGSSVKYNGTSFATDAFLPIGVRDSGGSGTSNAAISFGGYPSSNPYPNITNTYEYNGLAWSQVNSLNTARSQLQGAGSQSSTIVAAGFGGGGALSEQYTTTGIGCHCIGGV